jgi:hypothetical protein
MICSCSEGEMSNIHSILSDPRLIEAGIAEERLYESGDSIIVEGCNDRRVYLIEAAPFGSPAG